ncbi:MFS transporter [Kitasatospora sp. NPDC057223]|uniref:MFS transporter n=1 Tax=Kitasatospora sp. NPDC057223 TaxID=3346055 RepID=UPI00364312E2
MRTGESTGSLWRDRDFMLLWSGRTVSLFGSQISWLALPVVAVVVLKASAFQIAALGALSALPSLLVSLPAGVLVDRVRKRQLMICCNLGAALAMGSIPLAAAFGHVTYLQLCAVGLVTGSLGVVFDAASASLLPLLLGGRGLVDANGRMNTARALAEMAGPSIGGFLIGLAGAARAITADALSYLLSATALAATRFREPVPTPTAAGPATVRADIVAGLRLVLGHPLLRVISLSGAVSALLLRGVSSVWLLYVIRELHWSVRTAGLVYGLSLIGGVIGGMATGRIVARIGTGRTMILGALLSGPFELVTPLVHPGPAGPWIVAVVFTSLTAAGMLYATASGTVQQLVCPPEMLGRMNGSSRFLQLGALPLGPLAAGALATWTGLRPTLFVLAGLTLLWPAILLASPLRGMRAVPVHRAYVSAAA